MMSLEPKEPTSFSVACFYGRTRKRNSKHQQTGPHVEELRVQKCFRPSLFGPSVCWETFYRQQEAFDFADKHSENTFSIFAFESSLNQDGSLPSGQRRYLVSSLEQFWYHYSHLSADQRHHYEVIREGSRCKLYFDLEFMKEVNPNRNGDAMVDTLIKYVSLWLAEYFGVTCDRSDVLDLDASTSAKFSRHLVFQMKEAVFDNCVVAGYFVRHIFAILTQYIRLKTNQVSDTTENFAPSELKSQPLLQQTTPTKLNFCRARKSKGQSAKSCSAMEQRMTSDQVFSLDLESSSEQQPMDQKFKHRFASSGLQEPGKKRRGTLLNRPKIAGNQNLCDRSEKLFITDKKNDVFGKENCYEEADLSSSIKVYSDGDVEVWFTDDDEDEELCNFTEKCEEELNVSNLPRSISPSWSEGEADENDEREMVALVQEYDSMVSDSLDRGFNKGNDLSGGQFEFDSEDFADIVGHLDLEKIPSVNGSDLLNISFQGSKKPQIPVINQSCCDILLEKPPDSMDGRFGFEESIHEDIELAKFAAFCERSSDIRNETVTSESSPSEIIIGSGGWTKETNIGSEVYNSTHDKANVWESSSCDRVHVRDIPSPSHTNNTEAGEALFTLGSDEDDLDLSLLAEACEKTIAGDAVDRICGQFSLKELSSMVVSDKEGKQSTFCDLGVYTKNRNFRLYLSSKILKQNPLVLAARNQCCPPRTRRRPPSSQDEDVFMASLISVKHEIPDVRILQFGPSQQHPYSTSNFNQANSEVSETMEGMSICATDRKYVSSPVTPAQGSGSSPFPNLDQFINSLVSGEGRKGRIRTWQHCSSGTNHITYHITGYRWCSNIGREHRSNNIFYKVNLDNRTYMQGCFDVDCSNAHRSAEPIPCYVSLDKANA